MDTKKTIYVGVFGGLGNQLFQYAFGRALALKTGRQLVLDVSWFEIQNARRCSLARYPIQARIMGRTESWRLGLEKGIVRRWCKRGFALAHGHLPISVELIEESDKGTADLNVRPDRVPYLNGYWQDPSYFAEHESMLRRELKPYRNGQENLRFLKEISERQSVAVHIRRTDYLNHATVFHNCGAWYYQSAIRIIADQVNEPHFYFFSDDPEWARENIRCEFPSTYIHPDLGSPEVDLWLMSQCRHRILANSTFSWWGAWMAEEEPGIVITPKSWLRHKQEWNPSLPHWIILDNDE